MIAKERTLTDAMVAEITALFPRYPTKQAVTLPALHIVNDRLRCVPLEAVVEIAELLELAPAQVQDTLSFYGLFKQDAPHGKVRAWVCRSISCALRGGEEILTHL
jgi:NADH-quinone oxidoreductase subunit E